MNMSRRSIARPVLIVAALCFFAGPPAATADTAEEQAQLDAACEQAREAKLAPLREQYIQECVDKEQKPDREACERFYADFGAQSGSRAPLFYDLPECVKAHEFRQEHRTQ